MLSVCLFVAGSIEAHPDTLRDFLTQSKTQARYESLTTEQKKAFEVFWLKIEKLVGETKAASAQLLQDDQEGVAILKSLFGDTVEVRLELLLTAQCKPVVEAQK